MNTRKEPYRNPFFDESAVYHPPRPSIKKALVWLAVCLVAASILLYGAKAHAQEKMHVGDTIRGHVAICEDLVDALALLAKIKSGGTQEAQAWIQQPDNTCSLGYYTFVMGHRVGNEVTYDTQAWAIFHVHPVSDDTTDNFGVGLSETLAELSSI